MIVKKVTGSMLLFLFFLFALQAEVLTWHVNAGQQFEAKITRKESVISLDTVTAKPTIITDIALNQEDVAKNKSTIATITGIPSFPRNAVDPGAVWKDTASVRYNLKPFGLDEPLTVAVEVTYKFIDISETDSRSYYHIKADWYPFWVPDAKTGKRTGIARISAHGSMDILWDNKAGCPKRISLLDETQYRFTENTQLVDRKETTQDFKTVTDIVRERVVKQLSEQIKTQKVENVEVKQSEQGIVLSIENIQFDAESAKLADSEKAKLTRIGTLLSSLQNRKLSIVGHAANIAGSNADELLALSAARAQAVADFLVQSGIKQADKIVASGMGGSKPLASNDTPEGRSKNRRVEIVIMDEEAQE